MRGRQRLAYVIHIDLPRITETLLKRLDIPFPRWFRCKTADVPHYRTHFHCEFDSDRPRDLATLYFDPGN